MMHVETFVGAALLALAWGAACARRRLPPASAQAAAFAAALLAAIGAFNGPVHDLAERASFAAHMVQHLLLTLAVAPCMLLGVPAPIVDDALGAALRRPWLAAAARRATGPLPALGVYAATLIAVHLPQPFELALRSHAWHAAEHAALLGTAVLGWWPVLGPSRRLPPLPYAARLLYLFAFGMPMTIVAAMITGADRVLYPFYAAAAAAAGLDALADQRLGGILMWVPAAIVPVAGFTIVFFRWAAVEAESDDDPERVKFTN